MRTLLQGQGPRFSDEDPRALPKAPQPREAGSGRGHWPATSVVNESRSLGLGGEETETGDVLLRWLFFSIKRSRWVPPTHKTRGVRRREPPGVTLRTATWSCLNAIPSGPEGAPRVPGCVSGTARVTSTRAAPAERGLVRSALPSAHSVSKGRWERRAGRRGTAGRRRVPTRPPGTPEPPQQCAPLCTALRSGRHFCDASRNQALPLVHGSLCLSFTSGLSTSFPLLPLGMFHCLFTEVTRVGGAAWAGTRETSPAGLGLPGHSDVTQRNECASSALLSPRLQTWVWKAGQGGTGKDATGRHGRSDSGTGKRKVGRGCGGEERWE